MFPNSRIAELVHDISFAVFRVSEIIEYSFLSKELERSAVEFSAYVDEEAIYRLERLVRLAQSVGEIGEVNAGVLLRELKNLADLLTNGEEGDEIIETNISELFQKKGQKLPFRKTIPNGKDNRSGAEPSKRQTAILDSIRQFADGCRMADLVMSFPGVSQRTLRNDVGVLIENGQIERIGSRGPHSYLRASSGPRSQAGEGIEGGRTDDIILLAGPDSQTFDTLE